MRMSDNSKPSCAVIGTDLSSPMNPAPDGAGGAWPGGGNKKRGSRRSPGQGTGCPDKTPPACGEMRTIQFSQMGSFRSFSFGRAMPDLYLRKPFIINSLYYTIPRHDISRHHLKCFNRRFSTKAWCSESKHCDLSDSAKAETSLRQAGFEL